MEKYGLRPERVTGMQISLCQRLAIACTSHKKLHDALEMDPINNKQMKRSDAMNK